MSKNQKNSLCAKAPEEAKITTCFFPNLAFVKTISLPFNFEKVQLLLKELLFDLLKEALKSILIYFQRTQKYIKTILNATIDRFRHFCANCIEPIEEQKAYGRSTEEIPSKKNIYLESCPCIVYSKVFFVIYGRSITEISSVNGDRMDRILRRDLPTIWEITLRNREKCVSQTQGQFTVAIASGVADAT